MYIDCLGFHRTEEFTDFLLFLMGSCSHTPIRAAEVFRWSNHLFINLSEQGYGNANHSHIKNCTLLKRNDYMHCYYMRVYQARHEERALFTQREER